MVFNVSGADSSTARARGLAPGAGSFQPTRGALRRHRAVLLSLSLARGGRIPQPAAFRVLQPETRQELHREPEPPGRSVAVADRRGVARRAIGIPIERPEVQPS